MYQLIKNQLTEQINCVKRLTDNAFIPFAVDNTDYQKFKKDIESGVELQDPDENIMTPQQISDFLKTLP